MTTGRNMLLYVATYDQTGTATSDFALLQDAEGTDDVRVIAAVVMERRDDGEVEVKEHHGGLVGGGATAGGVVGLVVGLFAPPLLLSTVVGGVIGAGIGGLLKRHEERELGVALQEYLPPGSSAIIAIIEDTYLDRIDRALAKSSKKISKAIDSGDYDRLKKELEDAGYRIDDAVTS